MDRFTATKYNWHEKLYQFNKKHMKGYEILELCEVGRKNTCCVKK